MPGLTDKLVHSSRVDRLTEPRKFPLLTLIVSQIFYWGTTT